MAQKNDTNFRRMATQLDQRLGPLTSEIGDVNDTVSGMNDRLSEVESDTSNLTHRIEEVERKTNDIIDTIYPIGIHIITDSDPNNMYDGTTWLEVGTIAIGSSSVRVWQRAY
jgi:hypothetical protein